MTTDYESFLRVTEDGRIWWRRQDAIRLGAGFLPFCDDNRQLEPRLRAPHQRALVNEKTLIGALGDARLAIPKPMSFERDGFHYVDAAEFLEWLSQYICQTQAKINYPNELVNRVRIALAKAAAERLPQATQIFESLTLALEDWFDKNLDELPVALRQRVEKEFFPMPWDTLTSEQKQQLKLMTAEDQRKVALAAASGRRSVALQWDARNDPALEDQRTVGWECSIVGWDYWSRVPMLTAEEFCVLRHLHDPRNFEIDRNSTPDGVGKTLGERVSDDLRIIDRSLGPNAENPTAEWVTWAQQQSWNIPAYLRSFTIECDAKSTLAGSCHPVALGKSEAIEAEDFGAVLAPAVELAAIAQTEAKPNEQLAQSNSKNPCAVFLAMVGLRADEVAIAFVGNKGEQGIGANSMFEISARGKSKRVAIAALGLVNTQRGILNGEGAILLGMARKEKLTTARKGASAKMKRLRAALRAHLGICDDPFTDHRKSVGWEPKFTIEDRLGAADDRAKRDAEDYLTKSYDQMPECGASEECASDMSDLHDAGEITADEWMEKSGHSWRKGTGNDDIG